ncbi:serine/threonine-protein kinase 12 [Musa acuminata AAA Group]|uniref:serine/threonine-protein kinase 12 n=1 Tax=Musa acuminata AAA Group TaxID=214697 RepID=UPI0031D7008B
MEGKPTARFSLGKQSSLAPERDDDRSAEVPLSGGPAAKVTQVPEEIGSGIRLMFLANEGDLDGIKEVLGSGADVNFRDIDGRTALHVAACQGFADIAQLLLRIGAEADPEDRWGSTPLADAIHYNNNEVIRLLEKNGAKVRVAPMHVKNVREVPEYEIDPSELDFTNSVDITKGTFRVVTWHGIQVAVKRFNEDIIADEDKVKAFRDELALLQQIRHPNVVQFLGAVTQSSPMMIVTEYLPKGDLRAFLKREGAQTPASAVRYALDIARGMNYLHEHKPEAIIHRDLEPSNILLDDTGHLKVADFDVSKLLKVAKTAREDRPLTCLDACRYVAPEVFRNEEYDTKVDVFAFSLILQEMIEGCPPFCYMQDADVPKAYASNERPPFRTQKLYAHGLKELIERCWSQDPAERPTFIEIIDRLSIILNKIGQRRRWKVGLLNCCRNLEFWKKDGSSSSSHSSHSSGSTF